MSSTLLGIPVVPTQPLQSTPINLLYNLSNPFTTPAPINIGGTALGSFKKGDIIYGVNANGATSGGTLAITSIGVPGSILVSDGSKPVWTNDLITINQNLTTIANANSNIIAKMTSIVNQSAEYQTTIGTVNQVLTDSSNNLSAISNTVYAQDTDIVQRNTDAHAVVTNLRSLTTANTGINNIDNSIIALNTYSSTVNQQTQSLQSPMLSVESNMSYLVSALVSYGTFKNKIINGSFSIWQRGYFSGQITASIFKSNMYIGPDRWAVRSPLNSSVFFNQISATLPTIMSNAMTVSFSDRSPTPKTLSHFIENGSTLQGRTAVISFWARSQVAQNVTLVVNQVSPGRTLSPLNTTVALTTTWTQFSFSFQMPTLATASTDGRIEIVFSSAASWTMDLTQVQMEQGVSSNFEFRPIATELRMCQRFYEIGSTHMMGYGVLNAFNYISIPFKSEKRTTPTVSTSIGIQSGFSNSVSITQLTSTQMTLGLLKSSTGDGTYILNWTADAELY